MRIKALIQILDDIGSHGGNPRLKTKVNGELKTITGLWISTDSHTGESFLEFSIREPIAPSNTHQIERIRKLRKLGSVMAKKPKPIKKFRCTFEWDRVVGYDERNDVQLMRHICVLPMAHEGNHKASSGHTASTPPVQA